jgi:fermentation-respiration switch protein FrsA (DUF1100 family)
MRQPVAIACALIVVTVVAALWGLQALSRSIMFPAATLPLPSARELAVIGVRIIDLRTADGLQLRCAYRPPRSSEAPVIAYFHGNAESAAQNLPLAVALGDFGLGTALAEYRGYGGMPGRPTEAGLYADGLALLDALAREAVPSSRIILVGRSLGTGIAVELARQGRGRALVLISPYTSMVELGRLMVGPLAPLAVADRFDNAAKAPHLRLPAVVIHGTRDEVIPFEMGMALARQIPNARFVPLSDVGHNDIRDLPRLIAREVAALTDEPS